MDQSLVRRPLTVACMGFSLGIFLQHYEKVWLLPLLVAVTLLVLLAAAALPVNETSLPRIFFMSKLGFHCLDDKHKGDTWKAMMLPVTGILLLSFFCGCLNLFLEAERSSALESYEGAHVLLHGEVVDVQDKGEYGKAVMRGIWTVPRTDGKADENVGGKTDGKADENAGGKTDENAGGNAGGNAGERTDGKADGNRDGNTRKERRSDLKIELDEKVLVTLPGTSESLGLASFAELVGKEVTLQGIVQRPPTVRNPGGFDYRLYLRTKGVFCLLKADGGTPEVLDQVTSPILHGLARIKADFAKRIVAGCDAQVGGLILGMLFGDKSYLEESLYEAFQRNGVAHLLAVSGIHVNVVYLYIAKLLGGRRDLWASLAVLLFLLIYAALSGFSPSVMRATLMIGISMSAVLFRRSYDLCSGISAAAIILLLQQPYRLFDLGFQLSFLAVFSIAIVLPWISLKLNELADRRKKQWFSTLTSCAGPFFAIQAMMIPVTAYCFHYFSWSSFLLNPVLIPLAGIIVPMGILAFPLSFLPGALGEMLFRFGINGAAIPAKLMLLCTEFFSKENLGFFQVVSPTMGVLILFYAGMFFFCSESRYILRRRGFRKTVGSLAVAIFLFACIFPFSLGSAALPHPFSRQSYPLVFVDVGQGDCLHLHTPRGKNVLIDGGGNLNYNVGKKILAPYLLKNGIDHIDLAVVTHLHQDHYKGIVELAAELPIKRLGIYEANALQRERLDQDFSNKTELLFLKKGDRITLEEGIFIDILAPSGKKKAEYAKLLEDDRDENALSLIIMVHYQKLRTMMTGDMGFAGEEMLLEEYEVKKAGKKAGIGRLQAQLLKVGHHGSKYSTSAEFLEAVAPRAAIIQVGKNNFGHPSSNVIELLQNYDIITYRGDLQGATLVKGITSKDATLHDVLGEKIWHIRL